MLGLVEVTGRSDESSLYLKFYESTCSTNDAFHEHSTTFHRHGTTFLKSTDQQGSVQG